MIPLSTPTKLSMSSSAVSGANETRIMRSILLWLVFLEINPNGQWLWLQYMTEVNLEDPFIDFLCQ